MPEFVYFIQARDGGPVKIGKANDVASRCRELQCGNPEELIVRRSIEFPDAGAAERQFHRLFAPYRVRGEWFRACAALADISGAIVDPALKDEPLSYVDQQAPYWLTPYSAFKPQPRMTQAEYEAQVEAWAEEDRAAAQDLDKASSWDSVRPPITAIPEGIE